MAAKFEPPTPPFIGARHHGGSQIPKAIVLHGTVSSDNKGTARNIANWWHGPTSPVTSAHYVVDPAEVIQTVGDHTVAFHCGFNNGSIGIEFCDEQTGPASRWADVDSTAILKRAARLVAQLCLAYGISTVRPSVGDLKRKGPHGIYGHDDSRRAFGHTTHTDPRDFPWAKFLDMVRDEVSDMKKPTSKPKPKPTPSKPKPVKRKTFKILQASLHGNSATNAEMAKALRRKGVVGVYFSEAYKHGGYLGSRPTWRAVMGGPGKDSRGRMVKRDVTLLVKRFRKHIASGIEIACRPSTPAKIAPARYIAWTVDNVHGKPLAMIGMHPHAAVRNAWSSNRAAEYRRGMRRLEALVRLLRIKYGKDLDIVVVGDLNYPDQKDGRRYAPRQVFERLGMSWVARELTWVANSKGLKRVNTVLISPDQNGQDHWWTEVEYERR